MQSSIKIADKKERLKTAKLLRGYAKKIETEAIEPAFCLMSINGNTTGQLIGEPRDALTLTLTTIAHFLLHLKQTQEPAVKEVLKIVFEGKLPFAQEDCEFKRSFR